MISVLTPVRNGEQFIAGAISSVRSQTVSLEHLIIDGASTDRTMEVTRANAHAAMRTSSSPDRGQSDALNKGLKAASGDIVGWLNCDERYLPGALAEVRATFDDHPDTAVVYGEFQLIDLSGAPIRRVASHRPSRLVLRNYGCYIPTCATFIRRDALPEDPWDTDLRWIMDWDLYLGLAHRGLKFAHLPRLLSSFTVHPGQVTSGDRTAHEHEWDLVRSRYGIRLSNHTWPGRTFGRAAHGALKIIDGAYMREHGSLMSASAGPNT